MIKNSRNSLITLNPSKLTHKLIIGDNYDALLNLSISYKGKIDVIYIDPPYGKDDMGDFAQTNYDNAITRDNLLSMLYSRLILARELLTDEGVIFCSIDDKNQAYVKCLFDEIFGEINFIGTLIWNQKLTGGHDSKNLNTVHEYILIYSKLVSNENILQKHKSGTEYPYKDKNGRSFKPDSLWVKRKVSKGTQYPIFVNPNKTNDLGYNLISPFESEEYSVKVLPYMCTDNPSESNKDSVRWFWCETEFSEKYLELCGAKYVDNQWKIYKKVYGGSLIPRKSILPQDIVGGTEDGKAQLKSIIGITDKGESFFEYPKNTSLMKYIIEFHPNKNAVVLDFFAGSGTTGQAVLELNKEDDGKRIFILCNSKEISETTPNGIPYDVTSKRLKRVMTGECYDGTNNFKWLKDNKQLGDNLDVYEIKEVSSINQNKGESAFDVIDETLYGYDELTPEEKIKFICENFSCTQKVLE